MGDLIFLEYYIFKSMNTEHPTMWLGHLWFVSTMLCSDQVHFWFNFFLGSWCFLILYLFLYINLVFSHFVEITYYLVVYLSSLLNILYTQSCHLIMTILFLFFQFLCLIFIFLALLSRLLLPLLPVKCWIWTDIFF